MTSIKVKGWDKWQSFRKDRGTPPWIKLHRNLMSNPEWAQLSDTEKGQLVSIWIIAADKNGSISSDPGIIRKICQLDEVPNINKFIELDFLISDGCQDDANMTTKSQPDDAPEERRGEESREEKSKDIVTSVTSNCPHDEIIKLYHDKLPMLPKVKIWSDTRKNKLRTRWKESDKHQSIEFWGDYFEHVSTSLFLTGRGGGDRPFTPTLEWLITSANFIKVIERAYHND